MLRLQIAADGVAESTRVVQRTAYRPRLPLQRTALGRETVGYLHGTAGKHGDSPILQMFAGVCLAKEWGKRANGAGREATGRQDEFGMQHRSYARGSRDI